MRPEGGAAAIRRIVHPGAPTPERLRAVDCTARRLTLTLRPGMPVNDAVAAAFAQEGLEGGYVTLRDIPMKRLNYVIPALSLSAQNAAWYSAGRSMEGGRIELAGASVGLRDGKAFIHCHGTWRDGGGRRDRGHLLPLDSELAEAVAVEAIAISGAVLDVQPDPETNFSLFTPVRRPAGAQGEKAVLCTVRPNTDLCHALETVALRHGFAAARVVGIGSLVGATYADGTVLDGTATEILVTDGRISTPQGAGPIADLSIVMVDNDGRLSEGRLVPGMNPVCVTAELLMVEDGEGAA